MPFTVLIVDDDPLNIKTFNEVLLEKHKGQFEILNANNGRLALQIAIEAVPDVIITDWEMPELNGIELIQALKAENKTKDIPVLMASGIMLTSEDLDIALGAGAVDYIRKPVDPIELRARLRSALEIASQIKELNKRHEIIVEQERDLLKQNMLKLEQELEFKQRELTSNITFLIQNESERRSSLEHLTKLKPYLNNEGKNKLTQIMGELDHIDNSKSLLELENRFDELNYRFYVELEKRSAEITKSEKVLCAYTLLNLSPSEIGVVTGKNLNAVNVAFSRLRTKLEVQSNQDLKSLLIEISANSQN